MNFNRFTVIFISVLLIIAGIAIPLSITLYLSWIQAKEIEQDELFVNAKRAIQRSRGCLNEVYQTLDALEDIKAIPCSSAYIQKMQDMIFNKRCINEIEYIEDETVKCGSEAMANGKSAKFSSDDFMLPSGALISFDISSFVKQSNSFVTFVRNNYAISVDTRLLTDIIVEPYIKIVIVTENGKVISTLNDAHPSRDIVDKVLKMPTLDEANNSLIAVYRTPGFYYIVYESLSYVFMQWRKNLIIFVPFGLVMSLIACGAIMWGLRRRLSVLGELKLAVARREFVVHYQPIIELKTGLCVGAEALIRWQQQNGTMVRPDFFIPLAEDSGLIQPITDQLIQSVVRGLTTILNTHRDLHISINIAAADFNSKRIFEILESTLRNSGIKMQQIWLEITERSFMDVNSTRESLKQAREIGYPIVIDDFGTGYSSLSYLKELPIDILKIDKSFINSVDTDSVTSYVTGYIINLAKELNLKIVAEGVETIEQAEYLKSRQVDFVQGWLYAKAMPLDEFVSFYQKNIRESRA